MCATEELTGCRFSARRNLRERTYLQSGNTCSGISWDIAFSPDEDQEFIYLADGQNFKISIIDRASMEVLYTFGDGGRQPGLFYAPHSIATDSEGNIYTTETYEGKRVQKFLYQGMRPVTVRTAHRPGQHQSCKPQPDR